MKKYVPLVLLALIGCFSSKGVKKDYTTIVISDRNLTTLKADTMLVFPESKEIILLGDAWLITEGVQIHSDSIRFIAGEAKASGKALSINLGVHATKVEGEEKNELAGTWSADTASFFTKTRELVLRGNVTINLGEMHIESDAMNLYMKK